jgi:iron complex outermembrane receptor protein
MTYRISASYAVAALWLAAASVPLHAQTEPVPALPEVVVSASRFKENAQGMPYGVSVITASDIERAGVTSVNQALMKLLGVPGRVDFYGGGDYALDLRGFGSTASSNQVYVLDGIRINEEDTGGTRLAGIGIESVERIEVIHGSGAVMYGAGATGGVILITTKAGRGRQRGNSANLYESFGSFGMRDQRASATLNSGEFTIDLGGSALRTNNHRDNFKTDQVNRAVTGQWSNDWLRAGVRYSDDKLFAGLPGDLTAAEFAANPAQAKAADINKAAVISNERTSIFGQAYLDNWQFGVDAGDRNKRLGSRDNSGVLDYQYVIDAQSINLRARNEMHWGKMQNAFTVGYDQNEWTRKVLVSFSGSSVARQSSDGLYLQNDLSLPTGLRISSGLRAETTTLKDTKSSTDSDQSQQAWNVGLSQAFSEGVTAFGNVGRSFRLPNVDDVGYTLPAQTLQAQSSHDLELGVRWAGSQSRTEVRLYRNALTNELAYDGTVANGGGSGANVNLDPTRRQGLEVQTKRQITKDVEALLNVAWRQSKFSEGAHAGKDIPLAPNATVAATAIWNAAAGRTVNLSLNWVSSQSVDIDNQCSIPSYATWSTGYSYQIRNMEFSLGISNLTDVKYYTQAYSCTGGVTNGIYPEAGRAWTAAVRFAF